jgi:hypothetical protein
MLLLVPRLSDKYQGEDIPILVEFADIVVTDMPKFNKDLDLETGLAVTLKMYVGTQTASKLMRDLGKPVGDYTLCFDETRKCYTLLMDIDLNIKIEGSDQTINTVIPAILFQLYEVSL